MTGHKVRLRTGLLALAVCAILVTGVTQAADGAASAGVGDDALMDILAAAYPDAIAGHEGNDIVFKDGTRMPFRGGPADKTPRERLAAASLADMFHDPYPAGGPLVAPAPDADPGRYRNEAFFRKLYGDCRMSRSVPLVGVAWLPKASGRLVTFNAGHGAAQALKRVSDALDALPARFHADLIPPMGTFHCRSISGTALMSAHGTATAIDIATRHADYWQWSRPDAAGRPVWRNAIPPEIVAIFEANGFIWGGRWYHYDTMHFEYRPELIAAAQAAKAAAVQPSPPAK